RGPHARRHWPGCARRLYARPGVRSIPPGGPHDQTRAGGGVTRDQLRTAVNRHEGRQEMSEPEELDILEEGNGLTRRDVFVKGGLVVAGASVLGGPVAAASAAVKRSDQALKRLKYAVITHGAGDTFWAVAHKGASAAGKDLGVGVQYSESRNDATKQAQLINAAVAQKVNGIATSVPNPDAMKDAFGRAKKAGIPFITLNSGLDVFKKFGAITHVGQTETIAGNGAGAKLKASGLKHLLVIVHEQGNVGLEQRYAGAK